MQPNLSVKIVKVSVDQKDKYIFDPESRTPKQRGQNTINDVFTKLRPLFKWAEDQELFRQQASQSHARSMRCGHPILQERPLPAICTKMSRTLTWSVPLPVTKKAAKPSK